MCSLPTKEQIENLSIDQICLMLELAFKSIEDNDKSIKDDELLEWCVGMNLSSITHKAFDKPHIEILVRLINIYVDFYIQFDSSGTNAVCEEIFYHFYIQYKIIDFYLSRLNKQIQNKLF